MKYLIATVLSFTAMPLMAHHTDVTAPIAVADQTALWLVVAALALGLVTIGLRRCVRGSQD